MEQHRLDHADLELWQRLVAEQEVTVIKLSPEGEETARYPATVIARDSQEHWLALRAEWTHGRLDVDGLVFNPGDQLIEWFSPVLPFNAFAVLAPGGGLRGWYANVTYPAYVQDATGPGSVARLTWHDLYLDLVGLPDGTYVLRDEDELEASGLELRAPALHREIAAAATSLIFRFNAGHLPFQLPHAAGFSLAPTPAVPE